MSSLTLLPLQYQRQAAVPVDKDLVFASTAARLAYLTSPRRYAGMIVGDVEAESAFILNAAGDAWLEIGGSTPIIKWAQWAVSSTVPTAGAEVLDVDATSTYNYQGTPASSIVGLGTVSYAAGSPASYTFTPETSTPKLYRIGVSFLLHVNSVEWIPDQIFRFSFVGKSSSGPELDLDILFRHDVHTVLDTNLEYSHLHSFEYLYQEGGSPIYLMFIDNSGTGVSFTVTGTWTLTEVGSSS